MAISPGTERQFYLGNFEAGKKGDLSVDCTDQEFTYPFAYGYINVVESADKERFFGFLNHSEKFYTEKSLLYHPLDQQIDDETALFIPHMETAISIIHDSKPLLGDRVLITGAGVIGTLVHRILTGIMGIESVVFDVNPQKKMWFPDAQSSNCDFFSDMDEIRQISPFDLCIEASGSETGLQTCIEKAEMEAQITVAGWYGSRKISVNLGDNFHWKRLRLISSQVSNLSSQIGHGWNKKRRLDKTCELLKKIKTEELLTHRFPLGSASEAYKLIESSKTVHGLVALIPGG